MKEFIDKVNELPLIVKVVLCIPCIDIFYGVCRIIQGLAKEDALWIVLGVLTVFPGAFFIWILDLVWVVWKGHALLLGDEMFA